MNFDSAVYRAVNQHLDEVTQSLRHTQRVERNLEEQLEQTRELRATLEAQEGELLKWVATALTEKS